MASSTVSSGLPKLILVLICCDLTWREAQALADYPRRTSSLILRPLYGRLGPLLNAKLVHSLRALLLILGTGLLSLVLVLACLLILLRNWHTCWWLSKGAKCASAPCWGLALVVLLEPLLLEILAGCASSVWQTSIRSKGKLLLGYCICSSWCARSLQAMVEASDLSILAVPTLRNLSWLRVAVCFVTGSFLASDTIA